MIDDIRKEKMWEEIVSQKEFLTPILPHERTKIQIMREFNLTRSQAERMLNELLSKGTISKRKAMTLEGKACSAYSINE